MSTQVMLVTGGNAGIGLETVIGLARSGARVVMTSRDEARGLAAVELARRESGSDSIDVASLDLASLASIENFADRFLATHDRLDALIANAGVATGSVRQETSDGFEMMFGVNHLGHMALIDRLLPTLGVHAPSRVVVVSSGAYVVAEDGICFDDLQHETEFHGMRVYAESKLANIWYALELSRRLEGSDVTVNALNPGLVATGLGRSSNAAPQESRVEQVRTPAEQALFDSLPDPVSPAIGARTSVKLALSPELTGVTGAWWSAGRPGELNDMGRDEQGARRLWSVSEQLLREAADR